MTPAKMSCFYIIFIIYIEKLSNINLIELVHAMYSMNTASNFVYSGNILEIRKIINHILSYVLIIFSVDHNSWMKYPEYMSYYSWFKIYLSLWSYI